MNAIHRLLQPIATMFANAPDLINANRAPTIASARPVTGTLGTVKLHQDRYGRPFARAMLAYHVGGRTVLRAAIAYDAAYHAVEAIFHPGPISLLVALDGNTLLVAGPGPVSAR